MISTHNEWGKLRKVILGTVENFNFSTKDTFYKKFPSDRIFHGPAPNKVIEEQTEALNIFEKELKNLDVEVLRPYPIDYVRLDAFGAYCTRDTILVIGDKIFMTPTVMPTRTVEWESMLPYLGDNIYYPENDDIIFDAANVMRCNNDILYLVSFSGNEAGADWLETILGPEYTVHRLRDVYNGMHLDTTIIPLRDGLVMLNSDRIKEDSLPNFMQSWQKIWIEHDDLVVVPGWEHLSSNWMGMNILSYDENTIFCDTIQTRLRKKLENNGIDTIGVNLPHAKMLMGGHHCCTLDLVRD